MRCHAHAEDGSRFLILWGDRRSFKDLLWAALRAATEDGDTPHVVVLEPPGKVTPTDERNRLNAIATRCDIDVTYMREILGTRTPPSTT